MSFRAGMPTQSYGVAGRLSTCGSKSEWRMTDKEPAAPRRNISRDDPPLRKDGWLWRTGGRLLTAGFRPVRQAHSLGAVRSKDSLSIASVISTGYWPVKQAQQ